MECEQALAPEHHQRVRSGGLGRAERWYFIRRNGFTRAAAERWSTHTGEEAVVDVGRGALADIDVQKHEEQNALQPEQLRRAAGMVLLVVVGMVLVAGALGVVVVVGGAGSYRYHTDVSRRCAGCGRADATWGYP